VTRYNTSVPDGVNAQVFPTCFFYSSAAVFGTMQSKKRQKSRFTEFKENVKNEKVMTSSLSF